MVWLLRCHSSGGTCSQSRSSGGKNEKKEKRERGWEGGENDEKRRRLGHFPHPLLINSLLNLLFIFRIDPPPPQQQQQQKSFHYPFMGGLTLHHWFPDSRNQHHIDIQNVLRDNGLNTNTASKCIHIGINRFLLLIGK